MVLAVRQSSEDGSGDGDGLEGMRSMLAVFGPIENSKTLTPPPSNPGLRLVVFKYSSHLDAQHAVAAIGSNTRTSFSLHLLNHRGDVVPVAAPGRAGDAAGDAITRRSSSASTPTNNTDSTSASTSMALNYDFLHDTHLQAHGGPAPAAAVSPLRGGGGFVAAAPQPALEQQLTPAPVAAAAGPGGFGQHPGPTTSSPFDPANLQYLLAAGPFSSQTRAGLLGLLSQAPTSVSGAGLAAPAGLTAQRSVQGPSPPAGNADYLTAFDPNEAARDGLTARTTIMIRNIPCRWTAQDLLSVLSAVIGDTWDLLCAPPARSCCTAGVCLPPCVSHGKGE